MAPRSSHQAAARELYARAAALGCPRAQTQMGVYVLPHGEPLAKGEELLLSYGKGYWLHRAPPPPEDEEGEEEEQAAGDEGEVGDEGSGGAGGGGDGGSGREGAAADVAARLQKSSLRDDLA